MKLISTLFVTSLLFIWGCSESKTDNQQRSDASVEFEGTHTSQNSLNWSGAYSGILPCASCEGIENALVLHSDGSYSLSLTYLGEDEPNTFETEGSFSWNEAGNTITLENEEVPNQYFVGENYIAKLDANGERISGDLADSYLLRKE
ncbi:copper resistance protein NlpE [Gracilimonas tropica]|uniref:copper resistance protein NlpE n=1 Tax=Gracilimonas tropica TaxID=454600 RepID=UPI00035C742F|nr:copper resistance protein NlpE [Gracilimonas tropica]